MSVCKQCGSKFSNRNAQSSVHTAAIMIGPFTNMKMALVSMEKEKCYNGEC